MMSSERIHYNLVLVGGSPSNLALAHRLVDLLANSELSMSIAILEKSKEFGGHICSGAVVKAGVFHKLFAKEMAEGKVPVEGVCAESTFSVLGSERKWDVPNMVLPSGLNKEGSLILTLSNTVNWMATRLKQKAAEHAPRVVVDFFPGYSAHEVLYESDKVVGVQVVEGSNEHASRERIYADLVCFGDKGFLSGDLIKKFNLRKNPQVWSVGVKEVWQLPNHVDLTGKVWHTMGYPLVDGTFGGGFVYGLKGNKVAIGLIMSLDTPNPNLHPQARLQDYKKHPWLQELLKDAKLLKYGAALLPEGGYYSLPEAFAVDGGLLLGDALGVLEVSELNGVSNAMETGITAAETVFALARNNLPYDKQNLAAYQQRVMEGSVGRGLFKGRYFRQAWAENPRLLQDYLPRVLEGVDAGNPLGGLLTVGMTNNPLKCITDALTLKAKIDGNQSFGSVSYKADHLHIKPDFKAKETLKAVNGFDKNTVYSREDAVFYAGVKYHHGSMHIDEFEAETCLRCIKTYDALGKDVPCVSDCTAEVHRVDAIAGAKKHGMSLENCVQCRTCEIVCPEQNLKVRPTEQGAGPDFMGL
ncbi:MAG: 4Fe-4S dicluster domain-containing protein [Vampirovibrionales bacterium]